MPLAILDESHGCPLVGWWVQIVCDSHAGRHGGRGPTLLGRMQAWQAHDQAGNLLVHRHWANYAEQPGKLAAVPHLYGPTAAPFATVLVDGVPGDFGDAFRGPWTERAKQELAAGVVLRDWATEQNMVPASWRVVWEFRCPRCHARVKVTHEKLERLLDGVYRMYFAGSGGSGGGHDLSVDTMRKVLS